MIDIRNCIRIEKRPQYRHPTWKKNVYVFKCTDCPKEFETVKSYFWRHSGKCKNCSSRSSLKYGRMSKLRPYEARFNNFKTRCPETDLTYEDYLEFTTKPTCTYCDSIIPWEPYGENTLGFFLDRKNNEVGHLKYNLTVCCGICNKTKRNEFNFEEFLIIGKAIKHVLGERK